MDGSKGTRELMRGTFAALRHRNFRLWFAGQSVSLLGSWMQITAQGYLVFELTHSSAYLGYVAFAAGAPAWLFTLWAGVLADRLPRRALLLATQGAMMLLAAVLAGLTFLGVVEAWHILVLAFLLGTANAFDAPLRQAFVLEMVEREDLTNAIALNSATFNAATAVGPAAGGLAYAWFGPGWCFTINAVSFVAVIAALALMRLAPEDRVRQPSSALAQLREGLKFVAGKPDVRLIVILAILVSLLGVSFATLMPAWAVRVLGGDSTTNGFLHSARGFGALLGALFIAGSSRHMPRGRLLVAGMFLLPASLLVFSALRWTPASLLILVVSGVALIMILNLCNSLLQTLAPDALRGRIMSVYTLAFFGFMPLGGLLIGAVAHALGEPLAIALFAAAMLLLASAARILVPRLAALR